MAVLFKYGTLEAYKALSTNVQDDAMYFVTSPEGNRIYKGATLYAGQISFVSTPPTTENAEDGRIYVVTNEDGNVTIMTKNGDTVETVAGGQVQPGTITDLNVFNESLLTTSTDLEGSSGVLPNNDTTIPTSGAVKKAIDTAVAGLETKIDGTIVNVSADRSEDNSGTVLKFQKEDGSYLPDVTISDLFLTNAEYDTSDGKHDLVLYVQGVVDPIRVDLSDLIPTASTFSDVSVGADNTFSVNLGAGVGLGGFAAGDEISEDMTLAQFAKKLLQVAVPATYTQPSVSVANNGGNNAGSYEIGTSITPNIRATFNQADAGALTSIQFKKNNSNVGEISATSPATYTEEAFTLSANVTFSATASYAEGPIKDNNLGDPSPEGHIAAGSKNSNNFVYSQYRQGYFIGSTTNTTAISSATIRGLQSKKNGAYGAQTVKYTVPVGAQRVIIACPATNKGMTKVLNESALNADVTSTFVKSTVDVEGANGYTAISYNVWTFIPDVPYGQEAVLAITLG